MGNDVGCLLCVTYDAFKTVTMVTCYFVEK